MDLYQSDSNLPTKLCEGHGDSECHGIIPSQSHCFPTNFDVEENTFNRVYHFLPVSCHIPLLLPSEYLLQSCDDNETSNNSSSSISWAVISDDEEDDGEDEVSSAFQDFSDFENDMKE